MNPRYVAYARAHGRTFEEQLAADAERWPGGKMCGFIVWMGHRWLAWRRLRNRPVNDILSREDHADFNAWLEAEVDSILAAGGER